MPSEKDHVALANCNHRALMCLHASDDQHPEWVATIAFYKAVQIVEAVFSKSNKTSHDHKSRHSTLKNHYPNVWKHYRPLWAASTIARYLQDSDKGTKFTCFSDHCGSDQVYQRFVEKRLKSVEDLLINELSVSSKKTLIRVS